MANPDKQSETEGLFGWLGISATPNWKVARPLGRIIGAILVFAIPLLFLTALGGAFAVVFGTIRDIVDGQPHGPNLGAGALIAALLGAPFVIWGTFIRDRTLFFQREGQITDRISKAVEQLGAEKTVKGRGSEAATVERSVPNIEVRIGGLLSLERISQDSVRHDKGRDHVRVMEILCAYVRNNAPASGAAEFPGGDLEELAEDASEEERKAYLEKIKDRKEAIRAWAATLKPREDIQLALTIIGRRDADQRRCEARWGGDAAAEWVFDDTPPELPDGDDPAGPEVLEAFEAALAAWSRKLRTYPGYRPDLRGTDLQGADLSGLALGGARLDGARMQGTVLRRARMEGAHLGEARMEGADLGGARMQGAELRGARMQGAVLRGARMQGADLWKSRMEGAVLWGARMEGAVLEGARMEGAVLRAARMERAVLQRARMEGADLRVARMDTRTSLSDATLRGAALRYLTLPDGVFTQDQIESVFGDASVILPETLHPPAHWPDWRLPWGGEHAFDDEWHKWRTDPEHYRPPPPPED